MKPNKVDVVYSEEMKYSEEVNKWIAMIQNKLTKAYELVCQIFQEIQLVIKQIYLQNNTSSTTSISNLTNTSISSPLQIPSEKYVQLIDTLRSEIYPLNISYNLISRELIEDCIGWNEDVQNCSIVLKLLKLLITNVSIQPNGIQKLGDIMSDIVTSLQIDDDGHPLEFVAWKSGCNKCYVLSSGLSNNNHNLSPKFSNGTSMNISTFSPIHKGKYLFFSSITFC